MMNAVESSSTRPYLVRALYEWCSDNGLTPYVAVSVDDSVQVPREYVSNGEIVLNISLDATSSLKLGNDFIEFKARFGGKARDIVVPMNRVVAIYARENGQGMAFPLAAAEAEPEDETSSKTSPVSLASSSDPAPAAGASDDGHVAAAPPPPAATDDDPDPPPRSPSRRPALKRVK